MHSIQETKKAIMDKVKECQEIANQVDIVVKFDIKGRNAGEFRRKGYKMWLRFNIEIARRNLDDFLKQTVPHEYSHFLVEFDSIIYKQRFSPHGKRWKYYMIKLFGVEPKRCHNYDTNNLPGSRRTYLYKCICSQYHIGGIRHKRAQQGTEYVCRKCNTTIKLAE